MHQHPGPLQAPHDTALLQPPPCSPLECAVVPLKTHAPSLTVCVMGVFATTLLRSSSMTSAMSLTLLASSSSSSFIWLLST